MSEAAMAGAAKPPSPAAPASAAHVHSGEVARLENVSRLYTVGGSPVRALDDVSLVIRRGEFVAVMGPSGSGKSTLLHVLGCLDTPSSGRYWLEGEPVEGLSETRLAEVRRQHVGFIFQSYHLVPRMTAARNVELPLMIAGMPVRERRERVHAMLEAVGLAARAEHRPSEMSGGECQRVAIARALAGKPALLLADEPTGNLDTRRGDEIMALLEKVHQSGITIVMVTHDPRMAARAERRLGLVDGRLVTDLEQTAVAVTP